MQHRFKHICYNPVALLEGCTTVSTFVRRVSAQSVEDHTMGWTDSEYKGFAFEAFVEVLIKLSPIDKRINIVDYRPAAVSTDGRDLGIDGYGRSHNGNVHTVQAKFVTNGTKLLTSDNRISNFVAHTDSKMLVDPDYAKFRGQPYDMTVFTTASGLHHVLDEMYYKRVRTVGLKELKQLVDNNEPFWAEFQRQLLETA